MNDFVIITDSSADMSDSLARELGVEILPLSFTVQGKTYLNYADDREMDFKLLYKLLRGGETVTTSAVNVEQYTSLMDGILQSGKDVLVLAFSSGLSATYQSSVIAAKEMQEKYPDRKIFSVDTLCASAGQGLIVYLAAQEKARGKTIEEVRDWAEEIKLHIIHEVTVDDLHFLKRGGRISATSAMLGSMLSIKPMILVTDEGKLVNSAKARGRAAALTTLVDKMESNATNPSGQVIFIDHGDCLEDAQKVAEDVRRRFGVKKIYINHIGPVIGAHSGPGTIAMGYIGGTRR